MKRYLYLLFFLLIWPLDAKTLFFSVPDGWKMVPPSESKYVILTLIGPHKKNPPSINYAVEKISSSNDAYLQQVKKLHLSDGVEHFLDLGELKAKECSGKLLQFDSYDKEGSFRLLQLICFNDQEAHLLTSACRTDDYPAHSKAILSIFQSASFSDSSWNLLKERDKNVTVRLFDEFNKMQGSASQKLEKMMRQMTPLCKKMGIVWSFHFGKELLTQFQQGPEK